jgi:hypothetical protein
MPWLMQRIMSEAKNLPAPGTRSSPHIPGSYVVLWLRTHRPASGKLSDIMEEADE